MYIKQESIQQLQNIASVLNVCEYYKLPLKKKGLNYVCSCPLPNHNEKTASFTISPTKNIFKCFGCGEGGGALKLVRELSGLEWKDAVIKLAEIESFELEYEHNMNDNDLKRYNENPDQLCIF